MNARARYIAFCTLTQKEVVRFLRIWTQTLLPPVITMSLYFVIFGNLVGAQIKPIHGYNYMQYIAPGLIMMSIVTNAYSNVVSSFFGMRFQRSIEELLISPLPNSLILLGYVFGGVLRALLVGTLVTILALFFTHLHLYHVSLIILSATLVAILFSLAGFTNALFAKKFDDISIVPTFILTPLTYFGGVFYSINMLNPWWQKASLINPIFYMVNAFRYGILNVSDISVMQAFFMITMSVVVLFCLNCYLLNKGVGIRT